MVPDGSMNAPEKGEYLCEMQMVCSSCTFVIRNCEHDLAPKLNNITINLNVSGSKK